MYQRFQKKGRALNSITCNRPPQFRRNLRQLLMSQDAVRTRPEQLPYRHTQASSKNAELHSSQGRVPEPDGLTSGDAGWPRKPQLRLQSRGQAGAVDRQNANFSTITAGATGLLQDRYGGVGEEYLTTDLVPQRVRPAALRKATQTAQDAQPREGSPAGQAAIIWEDPGSYARLRQEARSRTIASQSGQDGEGHIDSQLSTPPRVPGWQDRTHSSQKPSHHPDRRPKPSRHADVTLSTSRERKRRMARRTCERRPDLWTLGEGRASPRKHSVKRSQRPQSKQKRLQRLHLDAKRLSELKQKRAGAASLDPGKRSGLSQLVHQAHEAAAVVEVDSRLEKMKEERDSLLRNRRSGAELSEVEGTGPPLSASRAILERLRTSKKSIKVLRNSLKSLVEPEECRYTIVAPNTHQYQQIEILPDGVPIYCRILARNYKSPATLTIQLSRQQDLEVYVSTAHKLPQPAQVQSASKAGEVGADQDVIPAQFESRFLIQGQREARATNSPCRAALARRTGQPKDGQEDLLGPSAAPSRAASALWQHSTETADAPARVAERRT